MLTSYYTLHLLSRELDTVLRGKSVSAAYTQEKQKLVLTFDESDPALVFACIPRTATLYLQPRHARARRNATDLLPLLPGRTVESVQIHSGDRVVVLTLDGSLQIVALCYGTTPNVLVTDEMGIIRDAFLGARQLVGTRWEPRENEIDDTPDLGRLDTMLDAASGITLPVALRRGFPRLGDTLVREVLHRAGIDARAAAAGEDERRRIQAALLEVFRALADPRPVIYTKEPGGTPVTLSLMPLQHLRDLEALPFENVHDAVRFFLSRKHAAGTTDGERQEIASTLSRAVTKLRRSIEAVHHDMEEADRGAAYEKNGQLLLAHLGSMTRGDAKVTLDDDGTPVVIALDPRLSPADNAQKYFARAKSARNARREAASRLDELKEHEAAASALLAEVEQAATAEELRSLLEAQKDALAEFGVRRGPGAAAGPPPFRIFTVDGGFEVWAGKNSANNDLLTLRHSRPNDLWFHVRGGGGAHVVLKVGSGKGEPGKKAREQAAGIAAWYSKMKNAGMVPVAMTLRKYVRKPKGAPAGTVTIEREDVVFVRPGLPEAS
jgi:predicted ribosome quality control (RQC) complex YloA/Tae2 family protein